MKKKEDLALFTQSVTTRMECASSPKVRARGHCLFLEKLIFYELIGD